MNQVLHSTTDEQLIEQLSGCYFCTMVAVDPKSKAPIYCTKYSGSAHPILVNAAACLSCCEYKRHERLN
ncbi:hypothetical protein CBW46_008395 [Paenibacillus xerothermodurans]|uniref:Uncharacterized protein n=1 Tax=Paenibacillus xerothermodurans TaxID=1977292 RepID=A0A2W1N9P5_PAEXE|nr:hypothetical protein CBW46_008395 [Paenibacillus xerothermodurans]